MQKPLFTMEHVPTYRRIGSNVKKIVWSPCGQFLASSSEDGVVIWDASNGNMVDDWSRTGHVESIAWSPTGEYLALITSVNKSIRPYSIRLWSFPQAPSLERRAKKKPIYETLDGFKELTCSPDGRFLAFFPSYRCHKVQLLDVTGALPTFEYEPDHITTCDIAWSPDGAWIAAAGYGGRKEPQRELSFLSLYNVAQLRVVHNLQIDFPRGLAWSADSTRLVIASHDAATVWDLASTRILYAYAEHLTINPEQRLIAVDWSPDGRLIAAADRNHRIYVWDAEMGQTLTSLQLPGLQIWNYYSCVAFSPDSQRIAVCGSNRELHLWSLIGI